MVQVEACVEAQYNLTTFKISGELAFEDVIRLIDDHYNESSTKLILWDGSEATVSGISADEFRRIAHSMKNYTKYRVGGKTAFVGVREIDYGLGRMYESFVEMEGVPCEYRTFYTVNDAREWLGVPPLAI